MPKLAGRRGKRRHFGQNLMVIAGGQNFPVRDISSAGLCFVGTPFKAGDVVTVAIALATDQDRQVDTTGLVLAVRGEITHISFTRVTMTLLSFIIDHMGSVLGVQPYYFGNPDC